MRKDTLLKGEEQHRKILKSITNLLPLSPISEDLIFFAYGSKNFNTTNPESLIYQNDLLKLTVLGGIKFECLDRMRSTLKVELKESSVPPVRHNLDLYNDLACEKLIRRAAEKLEIGTSVIAASMAELTVQLEEYR